MGAAIQASVLNKEISDVLLVDVTPSQWVLRYLVTEEPIIHRNTSIPCQNQRLLPLQWTIKTWSVFTFYKVNVKMADNNKSLGVLELQGIPPAPRGIPSIEVTFEIDADGIMKSTVKDDGTGRKADLRIMPTSGLSSEEIQQMISSRDQYRQEDIKRRELAEAKNELDGLVYNTSKTSRTLRSIESEDEDIFNKPWTMLRTHSMVMIY